MPQPIITIIYNPNSTGDGERNAETLKQTLQSKGFKSTLSPTKHAGHAIELAHKFAQKHPDCVLISSSGDGGYHEILNGVFQADVRSVRLGVLPSGNANDHYNFVKLDDMVQAIATDKPRLLDVLEVKIGTNTRYAHSYAGFGMTSQIGKELTKHKLNPFKESWIVLTHIFKIRPVKLCNNGHTERYDNIVFSTIGQMSKYLTLSKHALPDDGLFEITQSKSGSFVNFIKHLVHIGLTDQHDAVQTRQYKCTVLRATTIQLDGEVYDVPSNTDVTITCLRKVLRSVT